MAIELVVPEVGESIQEVLVGRWLFAEGQQVAREKGIVEIETDKISFEVNAPVDGTITKVLKAEGETAAVGEVIGYMEEGTVADSESAPEGGTQESPESHVMPSARRVLAESGIDASTVDGTGPGGRITKEDAVRASESSPAAATATRASRGTCRSPASPQSCTQAS